MEVAAAAALVAVPAGRRWRVRGAQLDRQGGRALGSLGRGGAAAGCATPHCPARPRRRSGGGRQAAQGRGRRWPSAQWAPRPWSCGAGQVDRGSIGSGSTIILRRPRAASRTGSGPGEGRPGWAPVAEEAGVAPGAPEPRPSGQLIPTLVVPAARKTGCQPGPVPAVRRSWHRPRSGSGHLPPDPGSVAALPPLPGSPAPLPNAERLPPAALQHTAGYEALLAPPLRAPRAYLSLHEAAPHLHLPRDPLALERFSATAAAAPDFQPLLVQQ